VGEYPLFGSAERLACSYPLHLKPCGYRRPVIGTSRTPVCLAPCGVVVVMMVPPNNHPQGTGRDGSITTVELGKSARLRLVGTNIVGIK
jgi:hypothetical protein